MLTSDVPTDPTLAATTVPHLAGLLYDLDGTMVNTDPFHFQVWQAMLAEHGIAIDETFYKTRISGRLNPAIVQDLLPQLSPEAGQQFADQKEARFREQTPHLPPLPGLMDLIAWARTQALPQGVVTNAPSANVYHVLQALGLEGAFDPIVIAEVLGIGKPDPAPYRYALQQFQLAPGNVLAFEDSPSGVRSAVGAGIPTVGIASTQTAETLMAAGAMLVIPDFTAPALWALLEQLMQVA